MKFYTSTCLIAIIVVGLGLVGGSTLAHSFAPRPFSGRVVESLTVHRDIPNFSKDSAAIVIGRVEKIDDYYWNSDHSMIQRDAKVSIIQHLKGAQEKEVEVTLYGGTIDGDTITQVDSPKFVVGQKIVLFLGVDNEGKYVPYALSKGVYTFVNSTHVKDSDGKTYILSELIATISQAQ